MAVKLSEQRARTVARELLRFREWDLRPISSGGQILEESEYRSYKQLTNLFEGRSKTGPGDGKPDFLLVESASSLRPLVAIETKPTVRQLGDAVSEAEHYGDACHDAGQDVLAVAIAGAEEELCAVRVQRRVNNKWKDLTLHNEPIHWIPSPRLTSSLLAAPRQTEVAPERPTDAALYEQATRMNEILRECKIKDEFRPIYAATIMLAVWYGNVDPSPNVVLEQINGNASKALKKARKQDLASSLRVDSENKELAARAWQIIDILWKLGIRSFVQEHDYLGQLYETFFRYTGGNTIGQYFTPRHIIDMMCELTDVTPKDVVFDPACGTGGFLIGALRRMIRLQKLDYETAVQQVRHNLFGIESEPTTAALCITNMILRGDGKSGIIQANCFEELEHPVKPVDCALMNPPFPHGKTDIPPTQFIDRALLSLRTKGLCASIVPYSLLVNTKDWHAKILKNHKLLFVATLPPDLFQPYASFNTAIILLQKGVPHNGSNVFFARLMNDGYKLKKNMRVPQAGSQLIAVLEAFDKKLVIDEMTAYSVVAEDSAEWSPEAYIKGAVHADAEFIDGLEQAMRNYAAFYIANGHRLIPGGGDWGIEKTKTPLNNQSNIALKGISFEPMLISDYFEVKLGGKDEIEDMPEEGATPIVSTSEFDNGVTAWRQANTFYAPPLITLATDGSTASCFVQEFPFYAFYKVAMLRPTKPIPVDALYFVAYLMSRERWRYVYARKFGKSRIAETILQVPTNKSGPDFHKMAELVQQSKGYPIVSSFRQGYIAAAKVRFAELVKKWKAERSPVSTIIKQTSTPAYREIISLGGAIIPDLILELKNNPDHWFVALHEITGATPIPDDARGNFDKMRQAWINWGIVRKLLT